MKHRRKNMTNQQRWAQVAERNAVVANKWYVDFLHASSHQSAFSCCSKMMEQGKFTKTFRYKLFTLLVILGYGICITYLCQPSDVSFEAPGCGLKLGTTQNQFLYKTVVTLAAGNMASKRLPVVVESRTMVHPGCSAPHRIPTTRIVITKMDFNTKIVANGSYSCSYNGNLTIVSWQFGTWIRTCVYA